MQVEVEYNPISKKDYEIFIKILARMLADFVAETKKKEANADGKERLLQVHPETNA
jgi:hypothetical protein